MRTYYNKLIVDLRTTCLLFHRVYDWDIAYELSETSLIITRYFDLIRIMRVMYISFYSNNYMIMRISYNKYYAQFTMKLFYIS